MAPEHVARAVSSASTHLLVIKFHGTTSVTSQCFSLMICDVTPSDCVNILARNYWQPFHALPRSFTRHFPVSCWLGAVGQRTSGGITVTTPASMQLKKDGMVPIYLRLPPTPTPAGPTPWNAEVSAMGCLIPTLPCEGISMNVYFPLSFHLEPFRSRPTRSVWI